MRWFLCFFLYSTLVSGATIAIIDTGFDLDHEYLKPKISRVENAEDLPLGWPFFDNSHLKKPVIEDEGDLKDILRYRDLRAKGHRQGLSIEEFEWYKKKGADKTFMEKARQFKKHSHGTFVAGIALREGENIDIFPIRGLNLPTPVVAVEASSGSPSAPLKGKTGEEKFQEETQHSLERVTKKFARICATIAARKIQVVNASYGITYKSILTKFKESYRDFTGKELDEGSLKTLIDRYFEELYLRGAETIKKYPQILFIFSAGNSGLNNDEFHHYPSKIKLPNTISVAALNGDYLATFSNFGKNTVDIGAPGVGILSIVPKVYSHPGTEIYSPASGTSMAAPYISNLAAQIMNANTSLSPADVKAIILDTGDVKPQLKEQLASGAKVNNQRALKAALLTRDMPIAAALNLAKSDLIPLEDRVTFGQPPAMNPEVLKQKVMESIPAPISPMDVDEDPMIEEPTSRESSPPKDQAKAQLDSSSPLPSKVPVDPPASSDQAPSSPSAERSPPPSADSPASSSPVQPTLPEAQSPESAPSSP